MGQDKEQLNKLLLFIEQLVRQPGNEWFSDKLKILVGADKNIYTFDAFIKVQRNKCKKISRKYYKNIQSNALRNQLIEDHSMMLWYKSIREIGKYFVYLNYQIENMLNAYCTLVNPHEKIRQNPTLYCKSLKNGKYEMNVDCYTYFFNKYKNDESIAIPKITSLYAKAVFWAIDSDNFDMLSNNFGSFTTVVNIRNEENHSDANKEKKSLDYILKQEDDKQYFFVEELLKKVRNSLVYKNM